VYRETTGQNFMHKFLGNNFFFLNKANSYDTYETNEKALIKN